MVLFGHDSFKYELLQQYHSALYRPILADERDGKRDDVEE